MNRQQGVSSLLMVLLLLALGSMMLQGLSRQHQMQLTLARLEVKALRDGVSADSLLEWGRMQAWDGQAPEQCRQVTGLPGELCLRLFSDNAALLIARSGEQQLWWSGSVQRGGVHFDAHGWSDFCPRREEAQCRLP